MFKQGIRNYFHSLRHFFTPLGAVFLGVLIGLSLLFTDVYSSVSAFLDDVAVSDEATVDPIDLGVEIWDVVKDMNWNKPFSAIEEILGKEWQVKILAASVVGISGENGDYAKIEAAAEEAIKDMRGGVAGFFSFCVLGFLLGFFVTKFLIRRNIAKRTILQSVVYTAVNAVLTAAVSALTVFLFSLWKPAAIISLVVTGLAADFIALLESYLVFARKKIPLKTIVNPKNITEYTAANLLIYTITALICFLIYLLNPLITLFVGLSLFSIAVLVTDMNAESYVLRLTERK